MAYGKFKMGKTKPSPRPGGDPRKPGKPGKPGKIKPIVGKKPGLKTIQPVNPRKGMGY